MKQNIRCSLISLSFFLIGLYVPGLAWIAWFSFLPIFYFSLNPKISALSIFLSVWQIGLLYFGISLYWLWNFQPGVYFFMVALASPLFAIYFVIFRVFIYRIPYAPIRILGSMLAWVVFHYGLHWTSFGTLAVNIPFWGPLPFLQIVSQISIIGFSAFLIGLNLALALFLRNRSWKHGLWSVILLGFLAGTYSWGQSQLARNPSETEAAEKNSTLALIQHNLPIDGEWRYDNPEEIKKAYRQLALESVKNHPDLIVFPLYSLPGDPLRNPAFFSELAKELKTPLLLGTHVPQEAGGSILKGGYFNVALFFSEVGKLSGQYQSTQAAPGLGFTPIKEWTAKNYNVIDSMLGKLGILLCYEDTNARVAKKAVDTGADFLIALSNPGHFTNTQLPDWHLRQDQLRAIESERWLVRVSSNGYSAAIDPHGRIIKKSLLNQPETLYIQVPRNPRKLKM